MAGFGTRLVGAMRLDAATFEDVEHDVKATGQAALVVLCSQAAQAVGLLRDGFGGLFAITVVFGVLGWIIGAAVLFVVGTKLLPDKGTEADLGQLLRTVGFAEAAGVLGVASLAPVVGGVVFLIVNVWILIAMVIAVRQALDYQTTTRAIVVCIVAWVLMLAVQLVAGFFGVGAAVVAGQPS
jgi:hypothetical protein